MAKLIEDPIVRELVRHRLGLEYRNMTHFRVEQEASGQFVVTAVVDGAYKRYYLETEKSKS